MALIKTGEVDSEDNSDFVFIHSDTSKDDFVICKRPDKLKLLLDSLTTGKTIHYISNGDWSMHDLVNELLNIYGPAELYITTYALKEFAVRQLINAIDAKKLTAVTMLLETRAKSGTNQVYQLAKMNLSRLCLTSIHAKITVLKSDKGCITIAGSANWTSNPRIEHGVISMDKSVAEFHINWIEKVLSNGELFK